MATLLIAGFCFGLAFEFRYQIAFAAAGVMGWVLFVASENRRHSLGNFTVMLGGVAMALALGTVVDRWGYGQWALTPWNYFRTQVLEGMAARSGTAPIGGYFRLMNSHALVPLSLLLTAAMLVTWVRHPRHIITWATIPFFVAHSLVAHKEIRYFFPMTLLGTFFLVLAIAEQRPATGAAALDLGEARIVGGENLVWDESHRAGNRLSAGEPVERRDSEIRLRSLPGKLSGLHLRREKPLSKRHLQHVLLSPEEFQH